MAKKLTVAKLKQKLQIVFNKYIRLRDSGGGQFTCMACGITKSTDIMNAGHFFSVGNWDGLRFDEENVHGECAPCNAWDDHHLFGYKESLIKKIGFQTFKELEYRAKQYKSGSFINEYYFNGKWDRVVLEEKIIEYKLKIKEL